MKKHLIVLLSVFFSLSVVVNAQEYILNGLNAYSRGDWESAIEFFEYAAETQPSERKTALYWLIMAHTSAHNYPRALGYADSFLETYPEGDGAAEVLYQKGRVQHFYRKYAESSAVLRLFISQYPHHPKVPSAYYWIAENDFDRELFSDARRTFQLIVSTYPESGKVNAAQYKIFLIDDIMTKSAKTTAAMPRYDQVVQLNAPVVTPSYPVPMYRAEPSPLPPVAAPKPQPVHPPLAAPAPASPVATQKPEQKQVIPLKQNKMEEQYEHIFRQYERSAELEVRIRTLEEKIGRLSDELNRQQGLVEAQEKHNREITVENARLKQEMVVEQERLRQELAAEQEKIEKKRRELDTDERTALLEELKRRRRVLENLYDKKQRETEIK